MAGVAKAPEHRHENPGLQNDQRPREGDGEGLHLRRVHKGAPDLPDRDEAGAQQHAGQRKPGVTLGAQALPEGERCGAIDDDVIAPFQPVAQQETRVEHQAIEGLAHTDREHKRGDRHEPSLVDEFWHKSVRASHRGVIPGGARASTCTCTLKWRRPDANCHAIALACKCAYPFHGVRTQVQTPSINSSRSSVEVSPSLSWCS